MKKSLIILFGLFCLKLGALGVGVDCWEEYTTSSTAPTSSNLRTAITNAGGTAILVGTRAHVARFHLGGDGVSVSDVYFQSMGTSWDSGFYFASVKASEYVNGYTTFGIRREHSVHYVHTYCVVDSSSGGGGGGVATGSVNFIIKATS